MSLKRQKSFFDVYAHEYDIMTSADKRIHNHRLEVDKIIDKYSPSSVLDAGCATGLTSSLFAESGIITLGLDRSKAMIDIASKKYPGLENYLSFKSGQFEKLPQSMFNKFDLIVCLANSISGVGSLNNLFKAFTSFYKALKPGGSLVLQMLNYYSINDGEFFPVKAVRHGDIIYQRFSERQGKRLFIYVNRLDISGNKLEYEMFRHEFENFDVAEVVSTLKKSNFKTIKKFADLFMSKPFLRTSRDLVITAIKK